LNKNLRFQTTSFLRKDKQTFGLQKYPTTDVAFREINGKSKRLKGDFIFWKIGLKINSNRKKVMKNEFFIWN